MKGIQLLTCIAATATVALAEDVGKTVTETLRLLQDKGIQVDAPRAQRAVALALAQTVDPGAGIATREDEQHRRDEDAGRDFAAGVRLSVSNGLPVIVEVTPESPAAKAGLAPGDVIMAVESNAIELITLPDAAQALRGHQQRTIAIQYRNGKNGTNAARLSLELASIPPVECAETLPNGICYIKANGLFAGSGEAIAGTLRESAARNRNGVILDLRGAAGGDLASVKVIASLFTRDGEQLLTLRDRDDRELASVAAAGSKPLGVPVMVLIDSETRGASELLAAVLNDSVRGAMIVGRESAGDPLIREHVPLQSGDLLYVATRQVVTAGGGRYDGRKGVKPDVQAGGVAQPEYDAEPVADRRALLDQEIRDFALRNRIRGDSALRRTVDILLGLKALNIGAEQIQ